MQEEVRGGQWGGRSTLEGLTVTGEALEGGKKKGGLSVVNVPDRDQEKERPGTLRGKEKKD